jgi:uncharacterized protein YqhQ
VRRAVLVLLAAPVKAVGGQAVMDGVMMRGPGSWAVAVRRHDGTIALQHRPIVSFASRHRWARIPLVRGVVALVESLIIGMRALFVSSEYAIEAVEAKHGADERYELDQVERASTLGSVTGASAVPTPLPHDETDTDPNPDKLGGWAIAISMIVAIGFSVVLFKIVPVSLMAATPVNRDSWGFVIGEVLIKFAIFCVYLGLVGLMPDMKRVFQYHSAEHKSINAFERGVPLEPEPVNTMSRIHVRCGTAFIVWLFLIGLLVFRGAQVTFLEGAPTWQVILARPVLLPIIAGLSFEILRFAGGHADNRALRVVLAPGLWFQRLTTRECTPEQCEVAIASLESVLEHERTVAAQGSDHDEDDRVIA